MSMISKIFLLLLIFPCFLSAQKGSAIISLGHGFISGPISQYEVSITNTLKSKKYLELGLKLSIYSNFIRNIDVDFDEVSEDTKSYFHDNSLELFFSWKVFQSAPRREKVYVGNLSNKYWLVSIGIGIGTSNFAMITTNNINNLSSYETLPVISWRVTRVASLKKVKLFPYVGMYSSNASQLLVGLSVPL